MRSITELTNLLNSISDSHHSWLTDNVISPVIKGSSKNKGNLYIGNIYSALNEKMQRELHIKHIINLSSYDINNSNRDIDILDIDILDSVDSNMKPHFDDCYRYIDNGLKTGNVLVNCFAGVSRSSTIVLYFLMRKYNMDLKEALKTMYLTRDIVNPNPSFMINLIDYEMNRTI